MNEYKPILTENEHKANNDMLIMFVPLLVMASYLYGARPLILSVIALLTAHLCDRVTSVLHGRMLDLSDNTSLVIAGIITMMMPASVPYYVLIISICCAVILAKEAFGGYGNYPFNPAAVGYVLAAVCWPDDVLKFPQPFAQLSLWGAQTVPLTTGNSYTLKVGGLPNIDLTKLVLGNYAGPMGATCLLVIAACAVYLWARRRFALTLSLSFIGACAAVAYLFPRLGEVGLGWPWENVAMRLSVLKYELSSGMLLFAAVFLINEPGTAPRRQATQLLYGVLLGITTMMYHYFGTYEIGVCFAVIVMNAVSGALDRVVNRVLGEKQEVTLHD